jgi:hypothetical protein
MLSNGTIMHHNLICGGMNGDEIGLTSKGFAVFELLRAEMFAGPPEWFAGTMVHWLPRDSSVVRRLLLDGLIRWDEDDEAYRATESGCKVRAGLITERNTQ